MKVFLGLLLFAGATFALVDEKEPTLAVPESKKTDLLITANGQTIKLNTDGKGPNTINLAANRFKTGASRTVRRMQDQGGEGELWHDDNPHDYQEDHHDNEEGHHDDHGNHHDGHEDHHDDDGESESDIALHDVDHMILKLKGKLDEYPEDSTISIKRRDIEDIIVLLEGFYAELEDQEENVEDEPSNRQDYEHGHQAEEEEEEPTGRRRRNRRQNFKAYHAAGNFRRHRRNRRQSVVHHSSHFSHHRAGQVQRIVVNP